MKWCFDKDRKTKNIDEGDQREKNYSSLCETLLSF
jgi:hypothetical protein